MSFDDRLEPLPGNLPREADGSRNEGANRQREQGRRSSCCNALIVRRIADGQRFTRDGIKTPIICSRQTSTRAYHQSTWTRLSDHPSEHYHYFKTAIDSGLTYSADLGWNLGLDLQEIGVGRGVQPLYLHILGRSVEYLLLQALPDRVLGRYHSKWNNNCTWHPSLIPLRGIIRCIRCSTWETVH